MDQVAISHDIWKGNVGLFLLSQNITPQTAFAAHRQQRFPQIARIQSLKTAVPYPSF